MAIGSQGRVLRIYKGQELQFHVSRDICCEYSLLNPAYQQAGHALIEILNHTKAFHEHTKPFHEPSNDANNTERELFEYGGNIILFAAPRGGGKTRMMLSFSHVLENPRQFNDPSCLGKAVDKDVCKGCKDPFSFALKDPNKEMHSWLKESSFIITEPIAPAALEKEQSILYVVLSRLYHYVEKLLGKHYINCRISESQKNELQICFHHCLSGINGLKKPTDSLPEDFSVLQDISDGLSLRYHFHQLITKILKIAAPANKTDHRYLVLQIDDADSKIDGVYEVFEDIRKYLLVPNLVILMSADLDFLHRTITEEQLKRFHSLQQFEKDYAHEYSGELSRIARKYIDKLIPPSHQINLPELGRIKYPDIKEVRLDYIKANVSDKLSTECEEYLSSLTLETNILRLIYRKTGVLFVSPTFYLHNIIPRTPRGINQLLFILNGMDDIPPIKYFNPKTEANPNENFIDNVLAQVEIAQCNLTRFSEYFIHDWIKVKIKSSQDRDFLQKFSSMANAELTRMTIEYLKKRYPSDNTVFTDPLHSTMNRLTLDATVRSVEREHRTPEAFLFFFAIRTLLTLNSHQLILHQKKKTLEEKAKSLQSQLKDQLVVFTFDSQDTFLTNSILFNNDLSLSDQSIQNISSALSPELHFGEQKIARILVPNQYERDPKPNLPFMNFFLVLLQLRRLFDNLDVSLQQTTDSYDNQSADQQEIVYRLQEYALSIVANSDVYHNLYRKTKEIYGYIQDSYNHKVCKPAREELEKLHQKMKWQQQAIDQLQSKKSPSKSDQKKLDSLQNELTVMRNQASVLQQEPRFIDLPTLDILEYLFCAIEKQVASFNDSTLPEIWPMPELDLFSAFSTLTTEGRSILSEIVTSIDQAKEEEKKLVNPTNDNASPQPENFGTTLKPSNRNYSDPAIEQLVLAVEKLANTIESSATKHTEENSEHGKIDNNLPPVNEPTESNDAVTSDTNSGQRKPVNDDTNTN